MLSKEITQLTEVLRPHFTGNRSRIECMAAIILGMLSAGTVNLAEITTYVHGKLLHESMYKRIQGFFTEFILCLNEVAAFVLLILPLKGNFRLVFDRTNWQFGQSDINYFVLAICYRNVSIPIFWINLDKRGCSSDAERIELLNKFKDKFGFSRVSDLLGDREFISSKLLAYLEEEGVPYTLRIKADHIVTNATGRKVRADELFFYLQAGEIAVLKNRLLLGVKSNICGTRMSDGSLKIIATNHNYNTAIDRYEDREQIERMFSCLKTRGFNLEDTHITNPDKLERLLGVVTIAFCWAYKTGDYIDEHEEIPRKSHGRRIRSIFKTGHVYIKSLLSNISNRCDEYSSILKLIFCKSYHEKHCIDWGYV
jgi:hypothetical protein